MPPRDTREMIDRLMEGKLEIRLKAWRAEGYTNQQIADKLFRTTGIDISSETIRRWTNGMGLAYTVDRGVE